MQVPATKPFFSEEDIKIITNNFCDILRGNSFLSMGKYGKEFEEKFAAYVGTKHAISCNSGTAALEMIFRAMKIEKKEVILPSNTFFATAIAIVNAGGKPVFADCNEKMCLSAEDAVKRITSKTAAITQVHIGGIVSKDTLELAKICKGRKFFLVEDACQAHGSALDDIKAGAFGAAGAFSFFSTKVMTTGEGGIVTTNNRTWAEKMKSIREFGKIRSGVYINYHTEFGYNWRMPEISALLGLRQLASIDAFKKRRQEIAAIYDNELDNLEDVRIIYPEENSLHNYFKYIIILPNHDRVRVHKQLQNKGISPSGYIYEIPLHKLPVFPDDNDLTLKNTEYLCSHHLCLPIFYCMTDEQVKYTSDTLKSIIKSKP